MFFLTKKMEEELTNMSYTEGRQEGYREGYKDGYHVAQLRIAEEALERANKALEGLEDEKRRLGQVYTWGYQLGAEDALAKHGIVDVEDTLKELGVDLHNEN